METFDELMAESERLAELSWRSSGDTPSEVSALLAQVAATRALALATKGAGRDVWVRQVLRENYPGLVSLTTGKTLHYCVKHTPITLYFGFHNTPEDAALIVFATDSPEAAEAEMLRLARLTGEVVEDGE